MHSFYLAALIALVPCVSLAQSKIPVFLKATIGQGDQLGPRYVFELKEAFRGSQSFRLVEDPKAWPYVKVVVVTAKDSTDQAIAIGYSFAYDSSTTPMGGSLMSTGVQACGRDRLQSCARTILVELDGSMDELRKEMPEMSRTLR